jgi:type I restriction enzyme S subunit
MIKTTIPKEWKITKAFECIDVRDGTHATPKPVTDGIPLITSKNIIKGKLTLVDFYNVSNEDAREINKRSQVVIGDILISMIGTVGEAAIIIDKPNFVVKNVGIFKTGSKEILSSFLVKQFHSKYLQNKIQSLSSGGIQKFISLGQLRKLPILLPPLPEQEKIVEVLETWNSYLDKLAEAIELKKKVKKGLMESLLSGKTQLKGFNDSWHKIKLSEACTINPKSNILPTEFVYIDLESVEKGLLKKERIIKLENAPSRAQRKLKKRDILFQMVRPYQKNNLYFTRDGDYVASTGYAQIRTQNNPEFLYHILHTETFVNRVLDKCTGSNYPAINSTDLGEIEIKLPIIEEQTAIAQILTAADQEIEALEKRKGLIEQQRRFLLNNMITGKLRLPEFIKNKPSDRFADLNKTIKKSKL